MRKGTAILKGLPQEIIILGSQIVRRAQKSFTGGGCPVFLREGLRRRRKRLEAAHTFLCRLTGSKAPSPQLSQPLLLIVSLSSLCVAALNLPFQGAWRGGRRQMRRQQIIIIIFSHVCPIFLDSYINLPS